MTGEGISLPMPRHATVARRGPVPVLLISVLAHVGVILLFLLDGWNPASVHAPQEIPVELVQAPPAPPPKPVQPTKQVSGKTPTKPVNAAAADTRKAQQAAAAKAKEQAKQEHAKQERAEQEQAKEQARRAAAEAEKQAAEKQAKIAQARSSTKATAAESTEQRMERLIGPMAAIPLPGAAVDGTESVTYKQLVLSQVAKAKKVGRYQGVPGATSVAFTIADDGSLARCEIVGHSADPSLDAEALAMVRRAAPFPAPPPGARREFVIGLRFQAMPADL